MQYISTRGSGERVSAAQAIKQGLASDGGLFMPETLPVFTAQDLDEWRKMTYVERAVHVIGRFLTDYTEEELREDCEAAYAQARFPGVSSAAPVVRIGEKAAVLELFHGPTCAFKDIALQLMPRLLTRALKKTGETKQALILVATSGDTGKAALEGYRDVPGVKIMVFYPAEGVSRIQKLQMATQEGGNVAVQAVRGNFDDAQTGVKRIFSDHALAQTMAQRGYFFSSANSINWGRLVPQIVYYVSAWCDLANAGALGGDGLLDVSVPTGNFGDIFAGYLAKRCGLPLGRMICASNVNHVLTDFFETGVYDRRREFHTTMSPSMDILISSNLERLLFLEAGAEQTAVWMRELSTQGVYRIDETLRRRLAETFTGMYCDEAETAEEIRSAFAQGYLCDPHTAVGLSCAFRAQRAEENGRMMLTLSTASPYKFAVSVWGALSGQSEEDEFANIHALAAKTGTEPPVPLASLRGKAVRFSPDQTIEPAEMDRAVLDFAR